MIFSRIPVMAILGLSIMLTACASSSSGSSTTLLVTPTLTSTPTIVPPSCAAAYGTTYYSSVPQTDYKATTIYSLIPLPPLTLFEESDAVGGWRGKAFCSGGTVDSIQAFMQLHLTQLGWQMGDKNTTGCYWAGDTFSNPQCWKNGSYALFLGINSATDWIIIIRDPDYGA